MCSSPTSNVSLDPRIKKWLRILLVFACVICLASGVPAVFIACIGLIGCELRYLAVTVLCLTYFTNSCCRAGFMVNHVDISPKYALV